MRTPPTNYHRHVAASLGVDAYEFREQGELMAEYERKKGNGLVNNPEPDNANVGARNGIDEGRL